MQLTHKGHSTWQFALKYIVQIQTDEIQTGEVKYWHDYVQCTWTCVSVVF